MMKNLRQNLNKFWTLLCLLITTTTSDAQTVTLNTGLTGNTSAGTGLTAYITFVIANNGSVPIKLLNVGNWSSSADGAYTLYYSITALSGAVDLSNASLWSAIPGTGSTIPSATYSIQEVLHNLNFVIPANTTYRFALQKASGTNYYTTGGTNTYTSGSVSLHINDYQIAGMNVGYGGGNNPRSFCGYVTYEPMVPNNASISALLEPRIFCANTTQDVKVKLINNGTNIINTVTVNWSLDGVLQTPIPWSSPLDTFGGTTYPNDTIVALGSVPFGTFPIQIAAWTSFPNSVADTVTEDDSIDVLVHPALSGTYTIGGASPDYATLIDIVDALNAGGVCGPVIINVDSASGPYAGNFILSNVKGTNDSTTIVFNGNGSIITSALTPVVGIRNVSYTTFNGFTIENTGSTGFGVHIGEGSHHLTFTNNTISVSTTATATTCAGFVASGSTSAATTAGNNLQYLTFTNNTINGGYYSFTVTGNTGYADAYGHVITHNRFNDFYGYGIYLLNCDTSIVRYNDVNRATRSNFTTFYGIYLGVSRNTKAQKNRIHDANGTAAYPFYVTNTVNGVGYETVISDNVIYNLNNTTTMYGMYFLTTATNGVKVYHNTIQHNVASGTGVIRGMYFSVTTTNVDVKNNVIVITGGGTGVKTGIYVTTASIGFTSNNNVIHVNAGGTNNIGYWGAVQSTLANWQATSGQDANSIDTDPVLLDLAAGDLSIGSPLAKGLGVGIAGFDTDIRDYNRPTVKPDPGAFQSIKSGNDAGVTPPDNLVSCAALQNVWVRLHNYGNNSISSVTIDWMVNGVSQAPYIHTTALDTIGSATGGDTLVLIGTISPVFGVNDTIVVWTSFPNGVADTTTYNDSVQFIMRMGMPAGTYSVGPAATYTTLTAAIADMQNGLCGAVVLELTPTYTSFTETYPIVLPPINNSAAPLTIRPQAGATGLSINGYTANGVVIFDGSSYITIDGRPGGTGSNMELTIENSDTSMGPAIVFINGSTHNTVKYVTAKANNQVATSGVVVFGTTTTPTGNNDNLIDQCHVNGNSKSVNCIYSLGSADPADNRNNIVTNSHIYDFFANVTSTEICGIALFAGNSNWTIGTPGNGNKFYQTAARTTTSTPALTNIGLFKAIYINSESVGGCNIIGNRIGGNIPGVAGSVFVIGDSNTSVGHTLRLIDNYDSKTGVYNLIMGNEIADVSFYSTVSNAFIPIHARSGSVNCISNTIGSLTGNGSLFAQHNGTVTGANAYAIRCEAMEGAIANNTIGSISGRVKNATGGQQLLAIYATGSLPSPLTITNNTVGGTDAHSIQSTANSAGNVNVMGICASSATLSQVIVAGNLVQNLSNLNATSGTNNAVKGIYFTGTSAGGSIITGNIMKRLYSASENAGADQTSSVIGITCINSSGSHVIADNDVTGLLSGTVLAANTMHGIYVNGTTSGQISVESNRVDAFMANTANPSTTMHGIYVGSAVTNKVRIWNNMVSLGADTTGASYTGANTMNGITKVGPSSVLYNTVSVSGAGVASAVNNSFAYMATVNVPGDSLVNNILVNTRTNSTSGGVHYAIGLPNGANIVTDYNLLHTAGLPLALFNSIPQNVLADWQTAITQDVHSVNTSVNFVTANDLHLTGTSVGDTLLKGISLSYITMDMDGQTRGADPYMGADEGSIPLPVLLLLFAVEKQNKDVLVKWITGSEQQTAYFVVEVSVDGRAFEEAGRVKAAGNSTQQRSYLYMHMDAQRVMGSSVVYYRLKTIDRDGKQSLSAIVRVSFDRNKPAELSVYPNPFTGTLTIEPPAGTVKKVILSDITGRVVDELVVMQPTIEGLNNLALGMYMMTIETTEGVYQVKLFKE